MRTFEIYVKWTGHTPSTGWLAIAADGICGLEVSLIHRLSTDAFWLAAHDMFTDVLESLEVTYGVAFQAVYDIETKQEGDAMTSTFKANGRVVTVGHSWASAGYSGP